MEQPNILVHRAGKCLHTCDFKSFPKNGLKLGEAFFYPVTIVMNVYATKLYTIFLCNHLQACQDNSGILYCRFDLSQE